MRCGKSRVRSNTGAKKANERVWFERWVGEGFSVRQLRMQSGHSAAKLYRIVGRCLDESPPHAPETLRTCRRALFDGTFLHRPDCIVVVMDAGRNEVVAGKFGVRENSVPQLLAFLEPLKASGLKLESCTVDGNPQAMRSIRAVWPDIVLQRCLVHVQRQGLMWCRRNPKRTDARQLRRLFLRVTHIHTLDGRDRFLRDLAKWEQRYGRRIASEPERGRVFSDLKRARSMLLRALPDMFHYLDNPEIPRCTNVLEGYFSRLKSNYRAHRGMKPEKRKQYFKWFFNIKPK